MFEFDHDEIVEILSKRGKPKISNQGYSYNLRKEGIENNVWRCRQETVPPTCIR
jgi:hypothetical protein